MMVGLSYPCHQLPLWRSWWLLSLTPGMLTGGCTTFLTHFQQPSPRAQRVRPPPTMAFLTPNSDTRDVVAFNCRASSRRATGARCIAATNALCGDGRVMQGGGGMTRRRTSRWAPRGGMDTSPQVGRNVAGVTKTYFACDMPDTHRCCTASL